jgi:hypothetical protein
MPHQPTRIRAERRVGFQDGPDLAAAADGAVGCGGRRTIAIQTNTTVTKTFWITVS